MTIVARIYTSVDYLWSAEHHARLAYEIEEQHSGPNRGSIRHRAYIISAVTDAVAFMESAVNEVIQDVVDGSELHIQSLSQTLRQRLFGYWAVGERSSILNKYDQVLRLADLAPLNYETEPVRSTAALIALRNYFVHHKPEDISTSLEPPKLASRLEGKFADNLLMAGAANPWFPDHAVSAGCARWACSATRSFVDHWTLPLRLTDLPYQNPGWDEPP